MYSVIRSTRLVQLLVALAAATSLAGGAAALTAQEAEARPCEMRGTPSHLACNDEFAGFFFVR